MEVAWVGCWPPSPRARMASLWSGGSGGGGKLYSRGAAHAGSWYTASGSALASELEGWLVAAEKEWDGSKGGAKALIGPHAGFRYSGPTAAYAYTSLLHAPAPAITRVVLLGPSHHVYIDGCALPDSAVFETPVGNLEVDVEAVAALRASGKFKKVTQSQDEDEHSLEMHAPYIALACRKRNVFAKVPELTATGTVAGVKLVPIIVGKVEGKESMYGALLAPYLDDPGTFFVVSSDFCHWGDRFDFTPYDRSKGVIADSIEAMDREGMMLIASRDLRGFRAYLERTGNTICGRNPICLLLATLDVAATGADSTIAFVRYAQSSRVTRPTDSSVSYASAVVTAASGGGGKV